MIFYRFSHVQFAAVTYGYLRRSYVAAAAITLSIPTISILCLLLAEMINMLVFILVPISNHLYMIIPATGLIRS